MQEALSPTPSVFHYTDFREFLKDWYEWRKRHSRNWSYGRWSRELGLKSVSGLHMVVNGERNPGPKMIRLFLRHLDLPPPEAKYFSDLVQLHKSSGDPRLSALLMESLSRQC